MSSQEPRPVGHKPPWRHRTTALRVALGVVLVTGAGLVVLRPWVEKAEPGEVLELTTGVLEGAGGELAVAAHRTVRLPTGGYDVSIGEPVDELPADVGVAGADGGSPAERDDLEAPWGHDFVPVTWGRTELPPEIVATSQDRRPLQALRDGDAALVVRVDDEVVVGPYDLEADRDGEFERRAVVVPEGARVEVALSFDGVEQVLDATSGDLDTGVAAALYDDVVIRQLPDFAPTTCRWSGVPRAWDDVIGDFDCASYLLAVGPWQPGVGWVEEPGQAWAVAQVSAAVPTLTADGRGTELRLAPRFEAPRAEGAAPIGPAPGGPGDVVVPGATFLLDASTDRLQASMPGVLRVRELLPGRPRDDPRYEVPVEVVFQERLGDAG